MNLVIYKPRKYKFCILVSTICFLLILSVSEFSQVNKTDDPNDLNKSSNQNKFPRCPVNSDSLYNRQSILEQLADILNTSIPEYKKANEVEFKAKNERGNLFFVHDLTDPSNKSSLTTVCIDFKDNHVYHFAPLNYDFSYSHIVILENGNLKVFKSINCPLSKDKVEDVIKYLEQKLENDKDKNKIIERVRDYRKYGTYYSSDLPLLKCGTSEDNEN